MLATEVHGDGPLLVFLHGFTQTRASWRPVAMRFAATHRVVLVDAPGHGGSAHADASVAEAAALVAATVGAPASYVGYSMGGRISLQLAIDRPSAVDRLVLVGATPGIEDDAERDARRRSDDELAAGIERDGVGAFLERWLAQPLFASLPRAAADVEDRLANDPGGLAASLRAAGTGSMSPLWDRLAAVSAEVLVVAGERDEKFGAIGRRMADAIGERARFETLAAAGHAAHLERPDAFADLVAAFVR